METKKIKVLIVDDSLTVQAMIAKHLNNSSYECVMANNGEDGWAALLEDESITLVFADMHMPVLNGMLLLQRMRESEVERIASMPVIMITGHEDSDTAKRASYKVGATDFISKPFARSEILCCAGSYTRMGRVITARENEIAQHVLSVLHKNHMLNEFGNKTISYSERHNVHASVMYVQVADIEQMTEKHGSKLMDKVVEEIYSLLENSLREEEIVSELGAGKFAVVLPATKIFKANIVARRLQQLADQLSFQFADGVESFKLAIGITSTESSEAEKKYLTFGEYCIQSQHALNMSLESRNNRIFRFDETYEKTLQSEQAPEKTVDRRDTGKDHANERNQSFLMFLLVTTARYQHQLYLK
jgi:diguanylate cyclase (GGDEF)-like protein